MLGLLLNDFKKQGWVSDLEEDYDGLIVLKNDNIQDFCIDIYFNEFSYAVDYLTVESTVFDNDKRFKDRPVIQDLYFYNDFKVLRDKLDLIVQALEIIERKVVLPLCKKYDLTYKSDAITWFDKRHMFFTGDIETFIKSNKEK